MNFWIYIYIYSEIHIYIYNKWILHPKIILAASFQFSHTICWKPINLGPFCPNFGVNDVIKRVQNFVNLLNIYVINEFSTLKLIQVQVLKFQTLFIEEISILAHFVLFGDYDVKGEGYFTISPMYIKNLIIYSDLMMIFLFWVQNVRKIGEKLRWKIEHLRISYLYGKYRKFEPFSESGTSVITQSPKTP